MVQKWSKFVEARGPDWFQELSNQQCKTVNDLAKCIMQDIKENNCNHTKQNMAALGLVLRPRTEDVDLAVRNCCGCPIEFLLSMYQLINPNRKTYSINDRLLLSSVVHLTIRETLRELHVRIPSPPRKPKPKLKPVKRVKKEKCCSPYLEQLFRQPDTKPVKYGKPDKQFPTNQYFSYKEGLKKNSIVLDVEENYENDPTVFQRFKGPYLDPYSIIEGELVREWMIAQKFYNKLAKTDKVQALNKPSIYIPCLSRLPQFTKMPKPPKPQPPKWEQHKFGEPADHENEPCTGIEQKLLDHSLKVFREKLQKEMELFTTGEEGECDCCCCDCFEGEEKSEFEESLYEATDNCKKICDCREDKQEIAPALKEVTKCSCREAIEANIEKSLCQCDRCKADRKRRNRRTRRIIQDSLDVPEGEPPIRIISGVQSEPKCTCLEKYRARWDLYQKRQKVLEAQRNIRSTKKCYIITGCYTAPNGEVCYSIGGVADVEPCACFKKQQVIVDEEKRATMPEGCQKYIISGVVARPEGNVYIISGATPNIDCDCMNTYNRFTLEHLICLHYYNLYMKKVKEETEAYLEELNPDYVEFTPELPEVSDYMEINLEDDALKECDAKEEQFECNCAEPECEIEKTESSENDDCVCDLGEDPIDDLPCLTEPADDLEPNETCELPCNLEPDKTDSIDEGVSCACSRIKKSDVKREVVPSDFDLGRYIILSQIPCRQSDQIKILKKALQKLAEDGWPLARLPDAYRLPHFKLWFQWRCGKFWTEKERVKLLKKCKPYWEHLELLGYRTQLPKIKSFLHHYPEKQNWRYAPLIHYATNLIRDYYYRKVKEVRVNFARTVFSSCYDYEFPTKTFRDVYFAYLPCKEEYVNAMSVWQDHEVKDMRSYAGKCST